MYDLFANDFEIDLIGQLPVALEAGSVLSRAELWGWFEEQILTQFLLLCNRNTIRNKTYSVFAQREDGQSCTLVHTIKLPRWRSVYFLTRMFYSVLLFGSISIYECNFNWFVLVVSPLSVIRTFIFYSQYTNDVGKALQR